VARLKEGVILLFSLILMKPQPQASRT
jgi:hypothetical protein